MTHNSVSVYKTPLMLSFMETTEGDRSRRGSRLNFRRVVPPLGPKLESVIGVCLQTVNNYLGEREDTTRKIRK